MARTARSALFDAELITKLEIAARHAGFKTTEQFCEAVSVSGLLAKGASGPAPEESTLADLGRHLAGRLEQQADQAAWFGKLAETQKCAVVLEMLERGHSPERIAAALDCSIDKVRDTWAGYTDELGKRITGIRVSTVIGEMTARRDMLYDRAVENGQLSLAWKIQTDYAKMLGDFGIIEKAVIRQEITHKLDLDDVAQEELDKLIAVREKRIAAENEIKKISMTPDRDPVDDYDAGGEGDDDDE